MRTYRHMELILYKNNGSTAQEIEKTIKKHESVDQYVIAFHDRDINEDGSPKKPHYHVYLHFGNNTTWTFEAVSKWFNARVDQAEEIHSDKEIKNRKYKAYYVIKYFTHCGDPEKALYDANDFVANFDVAQYLKTAKEEIKKEKEKKNNKEELELLVKKCSDGEIMRYNYHEHIPADLYTKYASRFEHAFKFADDKYLAENKGQRDCQVIWIWGGAGTGKTQIALMFSEQSGEASYITHTGNDPFDSYQDQPILILDDIRPNDPLTYSELLKILDPHHMAGAHSRYHDKNLKAKMIFVATVYSPSSFYKGCFNRYELSEKDIDTLQQLNRRLYEIWQMTDEKIIIKRYNEKKKTHENFVTMDNPVPGYIARIIPDSNKINTLSVLKNLVNEYNPKNNGVPGQIEMYPTDSYNASCLNRFYQHSTESDLIKPVYISSDSDDEGELPF